MYALVVIVHIVVSVILILVVLLQSGKAGDLASAFGGAGSQTAFGARGAATILTKATTICAILFMVTSLALSIMYTRGVQDTVLEALPAAEEPAPVESTEPVATPDEPAATPGEESSEPGGESQEPSP